MRSIEALSDHCARVIKLLPNRALEPQSRIAIYGAGFLGEWTIRWLREVGVNPVACFDGNAARHGTEFHDIPIEPPSRITTVKPDFTFVTARHATSSVQKVLDGYGAKSCPIESYLVSVHFEQFRALHDETLDDERSKETLLAVLSAILTGEATRLHPVIEADQYFCLPQFSGAGHEVFVDAGAYVGDSMERFIWSTGGAFSSIHAFEPGARQFSALKRRAERLSQEWALEEHAIKLNHAGLADHTGYASSATSSGQMQSLTLAPADAEATAICTLDGYLSGNRVTFIKADVEGMELALLRGAAETISRWKPKLAICVYHYPLDLLDAVHYISSLVPAYRFALRHHSPQQMETVLYCWVP